MTAASCSVENFLAYCSIQIFGKNAQQEDFRMCEFGTASVIVSNQRAIEQIQPNSIKV